MLKSNCRLLSGARMEDQCVLLEHTLVLSGEVLSYGSVWQGWPSEVHMPLKDYYDHMASLLEYWELKADRCRDSRDRWLVPSRSRQDLYVPLII